jgi:hypothetical protein
MTERTQLTREEVLERVRKKESFAATQLTEMDLHELDLSGADFREALRARIFPKPISPIP